MLKLLVFPLRLCVGWGLSPRLLGLIGVCMLVLLRLSIGCHFYSEGLDKYKSGNWDSTPFFANARGPFAENFRAIVWDADGSLRRDVEQTKQWWAGFRDRIGRHYGFDEAQKKTAQQNYSDAVALLESVLEANDGALSEYDLGRQRIEEMSKDPSRSGVDSLKGQKETVRRELIDQIAPVFEEIDALWVNYESAQNAVANSDQKQAEGPLSLGTPAIGVMDTNRLNRIVPFFDMAIGLCLLLGLFTPVASLAAAALLAQVFLSQYPPTAGPGSTYYQLIECMACLVLAGTGAGRLAGLDYFLHLIVRKTCGTASDKD